MVEELEPDDTYFLRFRSAAQLNVAVIAGLLVKRLPAFSLIPKPAVFRCIHGKDTFRLNCGQAVYPSW